jgi:hypothetical protein
MSSKSITDFLKRHDDNKRKLSDLERCQTVLFQDRARVSIQVLSKTSCPKLDINNRDFLDSLSELFVAEMVRLKTQIERDDATVEVLSRAIR